MTTQIVKVPDIGGVEGVEVIEICVAVGDQITQEDSLVVLESDKASMEVPSPFTGKVVTINVSSGDNLSEGDTILALDVDSIEADQKQDSVVDVAVSALEGTVVETPEVVNQPAASAQIDAVATSSKVETVRIPDIGSDSADVIEICVSTGDQVVEGDSLIVLETDKASMEVPAPKAGTVLSVIMKEGEKASEGAVILELEVGVSQAEPKPEKPSSVKSLQHTVLTANKQNNETGIPAPAFASLQTPTRERQTDITAPNSSHVYAGPAVRKLARELGVQLQNVNGTGPKGRVAKDDLKVYVKNTLQGKNTNTQVAGIPPVPEVDFSVFGKIVLEPLSKIQKLTASNMQRNWLNIPHVTQFDDADISDLEDFRQSLKAEAQERAVKITPLPFLLKACAFVLKKHPKFNASLHNDGEHLVFKHYVHIGVAVDTPIGLLVPVIRDVDKKSIWELAKESAELAAKAKERKLKPSEMQGGCFTVSSLGGIGGQGFTPIVNAPEVGILGVSKLAIKPVWNGGEFEPRKMLPLALSYDHRAINGVDAGQFLTELTRLLSDIRQLAL